MRQNETPNSDGLTERQALALPFLVSTASLREGAKFANIGRATLHRWMHDDAFREKLQHMRGEAANLAHAELQGLMLKSVLVLAEALDDPDLTTRLRAARSALYVALKADETRDLRHRLDALDDALTLLKRQL